MEIKTEDSFRDIRDILALVLVVDDTEKSTTSCKVGHPSPIYYLFRRLCTLNLKHAMSVNPTWPPG